MRSFHYSLLPPALLSAGLVLLGLFCQNLGAAFAKQLFADVGVEGMVALRVGVSAALLLAVFRPWRHRLTIAEAANVMVYGLMLGLMNFCIYRAFSFIPIGIAVAIEVTGPLCLVIWSSRRRADFFWAGLVIGGLSLLLPVFSLKAAPDARGVLYALAAAACWAAYIIFGKRVSGLPQGQAVSWGMLAAALIMVPLGLERSGAALLNTRVLLLGLIVAVLSSAIPYALEMAALRHLPRRVFGILVSAAPAIAALSGFAVLHEHLGTAQIIAVTLVMIGCAGAAATAQTSAG